MKKLLSLQIFSIILIPTLLIPQVNKVNYSNIVKIKSEDVVISDNILTLWLWGKEEYIKCLYKPDINEKTHIYKKSESDMEYAVIVDSYTGKTDWNFIINGWEKFNFYYQPKLTDKDINCTRPDNIIGSYAVYHKYKSNNKYKTGKAWNIYRPLIIDSNGNSIYGTQRFYNGVLTVRVDREWLAQAKYPIIVDPTFGYSTHGSSQESFSASDYVNYIMSSSNPSSNGTLTNIMMYCVGNSGASSIIAALYSDNGSSHANNRLGQQTTPVSSPYPSAEELSISVSASVSSGTKYHFSFINSTNSLYVYYDTTGTNAEEYESGSSFPSTATPSSYNTDRRHSVWGIYTEDGGGGETPASTTGGSNYQNVSLQNVRLQ